MRFMVLACDYDGTLATKGVIDNDTAKALVRCRESGRKLVMVTGRELPELIALCPQIDLFERVVAENGALLYRPATRDEVPLGPPPDEQFVATLRQAGVTPISIGHVIVATWEPYETTVLRAIHDLGLEMQVIFNKGAVMVLPSGINKATGLAVALKEMGYSPHNVAAVGDAENDHALFNACEAGVAVFNAVEMLKKHADLVTVADHGAGVAELIDKLIADDLAEIECTLIRHHIMLGHDQHGNDVRVSPCRRNALIAGSSVSGKSTIATAIIDHLIDCNYQVCVIDPEGDYDDFEGTVSVGGAEQAPTVEEVMKLLESATDNVAVNLSAVPYQDRQVFCTTLMTRLQQLRARRGRPHWIAVDEANYVWPENWEANSAAAPDRLERTLFITNEPGLLPAAVLSTVDLVLAVGKTPQKTLLEFAERTGLPRPDLAETELDPGTALVWDLKAGSPITAVKIQLARRRE